MRKTISFVAVLVTALSIFWASPSASAQTLPSQNTILVFPFTASSDANAWIGKAVQQDLLTDLTQGTTARILAPANLPPAADSEVALRTARDMGATQVIFGMAQSTPKEIRLTGAILNVSTGEPLAGLKATGPADELFHLEDALAGQTLAALPAAMVKARPAAGSQSVSAPVAPQGDQAPSPTAVYTPPVTTEVPPTVYTPSVETYPPFDGYYQAPAPDYYPAYTYPYPSLGLWPYWGGGVVIFGNGFHNHFHDHEGFHHGGGILDGGHHEGNHEFRSTTRLGSAGAARSNSGRSGFTSSALPRQSFGATAAPRISSGGLRSGGFHATSGGISRGFSGGGARGFSSSGAHGGGGHR